MWGIFRKQSKIKQILKLPIIRDFYSYTGNKILYKSEEYFEIMNRKLKFSVRGFRSHPLLFDIMIKENHLYYIGINQEIVKII